ncbi:MAG: FAD-dependent oxidoreductase [Spirochaetales bacterium]|nr:FAD-dependent oxidoreductase [Spirochaetales bacterium]
MKTYEALVIGGGPAAISLVKTIGPKLRTAVIRPEDHSLIYCAMPYAIEEKVPMAKTFKRDELVTDTGAELIRDTVSSVDFDARTVATASGAVYGWERLVIATGARPLLPPLPGVELPGVFTFKTEDDMKAIAAAIDAGATRAVVVGAGAIGIELAQAFVERGLETHVVEFAPSILPNLVDADMVEEALADLARMGARMHLDHGVSALREHGRVEEVALSKGEPIRFLDDEEAESGESDAAPRGIVVFAVGTRAETALFAGGPLELGPQGIVVNGRMETNIPGVYAVGDCVQFASAITGELAPGKLATNAVPMGKLLGAALLGSKVEYRGFYNGAATKVGPWFVGGVGLTEAQARKRHEIMVGEASLTTTFPIMPESKPARLKLVADRATGKLLGAQIVSGAPVTDKVDQLTMAIQYGIPVAELEYFSYSSQPYQSYYPADNLIVHAVRAMAPRPA